MSSLEEPKPVVVSGKEVEERVAWWYPLGVLGLLAVTGWFQYELWFGQQGLVRWRQIGGQLVEAQLAVVEAQGRISAMERGIIALERDPLVLEEEAKRELGMVHPDELIFVLPRGAR